MNATNPLGNSSSEEHQVHVRDILKPVQVKNFRDKVEREHNSLHITWRTPKSGQALEYNVTYSSQYDSDVKEVVVPSTKNDTLNLLLPNLTAHTVYDMCVKCRFTAGGYWSEQACRSDIITRKRAPDQAPEVTESGYYVFKKNKNDSQLTCSRTVRLYWKPVPVQLLNGKITGYEIHHSDSGEWETLPASATKLWLDVPNLLCNKTYLFHVKVRNDVASSDFFKTSIRVNAENDVPDFPLNFTVISLNDSSVLVSWHPDEHLESVTVFWTKCPPPFMISDQCSGELSWQIVPANQGNVTLEAVYPSRNHVYGMAASTASANTGIHWASNVYNITQVSEAPKAEVKKTTSTTVSLQLTRPSGPGVEDMGYIYMYRVYIHPPPENAQCAEGLIECKANESSRAIYTLTSLRPETNYRIEVASVTVAGMSAYKTQILTKTAKAGGLSRVVWGGVIPVCIVVGIVMLIGAVKGVRWLSACGVCKVLKEPVKLPQPVSPDITRTGEITRSVTAHSLETYLSDGSSVVFTVQNSPQTQSPAARGYNRVNSGTSLDQPPVSPVSTTPLLVGSVLPRLYTGARERGERPAIRDRVPPKDFVHVGPILPMDSDEEHDSDDQWMGSESTVSNNAEQKTNAMSTSYNQAQIVHPPLPDFSSPPADMSCNDTSGETLIRAVCEPNATRPSGDDNLNMMELFGKHGDSSTSKPTKPVLPVLPALKENIDEYAAITNKTSEGDGLGEYNEANTVDPFKELKQPNIGNGPIGVAASQELRALPPISTDPFDNYCKASPQNNVVETTQC